MISERHSGYAPPNRLYRASRGAMIFGVCAGIADYFGFDRTVTRIVAALAALIFFPAVAICYIILALLLPKYADSAEPEPREFGRRRDEAERARGGPANHQKRFDDLDERLRKLEEHVTSRRFRLEREFEKLKEDGR